jgi:ABC-2 type transport system permease protein
VSRPARWLPAWAIVDRDLRKYWRSPGLLLASLFIPLLQLVILGYAFGGKVRDVGVGLVDLDRGTEALRLHEMFEAVEANPRTFRIHTYGDVESALADTRRGRVRATIVIPADYSLRVKKGEAPEIGLVLDNTDPFVTTTLNEKMREVVAALRTSNVELRVRTEVELAVVEIYPWVEYIQYLLPGAITMAIFFCALIGGGLLYIDDKVRGIHEAYLVSPISKLQLVLGMHLSGVLKGVFAGSFVALVGIVIAGLPQALHPARFLLLVAFSAVVSSSLVSMVSLLMVRVDDPMIPRVVIGILNTILFFPSGAVYPISSFPTWLQWVAAVDPFTYAIRGLRSMLLKDVGLEALWSDALILGAASAVCLGGVLVLFQRRL